VFNMPEKTAKMLRADLADAGTLMMQDATEIFRHLDIRQGVC